MLDISPAFANLGTETAFSVLARAKALEASGRRIVNLGIGQPDFAPPDHVQEAAIKAIRDGHHGYTPANGVAPLREAVVHYVATWHGATIEADQVLVVPGGKMTMFFAFLMFGRPGVEIVYPDPGFPIYESTVRFTGATAVPYALDPALAHAPRASEILSKITPATRLVVVNSPANPTGGVMPEEEIRALVKGLASHPHVAILADEIYSRMVYGGRHLSLLSFPEIADRVILLDGWSKTFAMTGWRLGFGVWPRDLIAHAERLAVNSNSCVNAVAQQAALAALDGPQDAVDRMMVEFDKRRQFIVERVNALPGWSCAMPQGAFYAFPDVSGTGMGESELQSQLLEEVGVATVAGTSFGRAGKGHLRLSYAASIADLEEAVAKIARL